MTCGVRAVLAVIVALAGLSQPVQRAPSMTDTWIASTTPPATTKPSRALTGRATWYAYRPGQAAAGPALRRALGKSWRGRTVTVCAGGRCVRALLTDWCLCSSARGGGRIIDLDSRTFAAIAPLSRGVVRVDVRW